mmetsp:Transcript_160243/g.514127  ORF Transcript_160243/g.514127 Transcript_160243/m.514127 type:complete len:227 (-) Transcript_160243:3009-3689(-)
MPSGNHMLRCSLCRKAQNCLAGAAQLLRQQIVDGDLRTGGLTQAHCVTQHLRNFAEKLLHILPGQRRVHSLQRLQCSLLAGHQRRHQRHEFQLRQLPAAAPQPVPDTPPVGQLDGCSERFLHCSSVALTLTSKILRQRRGPRVQLVHGAKVHSLLRGLAGLLEVLDKPLDHTLGKLGPHGGIALQLLQGGLQSRHASCAGALSIVRDHVPLRDACERLRPEFRGEA